MELEIDLGWCFDVWGKAMGTIKGSVSVSDGEGKDFADLVRLIVEVFVGAIGCDRI